MNKRRTDWLEISRRLARVGLVSMVLLAILQPDLVVACPNCKKGLIVESATGFAFSIGLMLAVPFAIFSGWLYAALRMTTRKPGSSFR